MSDLRFAVLGTGSQSRYQLAAWQEQEGARCAALYNRTKTKAELMAREFNVPRVYDDVEALLKNEALDFVDIGTDAATHPQFVELAARYGVAIICQTPMAPTLEQARAMVENCKTANVPFFIHENWRWQTPLRQLKKVLDSSRIGQPFRARLDFVCSFPIFNEQPTLRELEQCIIADIGSHILDTARFLFGEARSVACHVQRIQPGIKGEDVATIWMQMEDVIVTCNLSYASRTEHERFPQTFAFIEASEGSVELANDYLIRTTNRYGTLSQRHAPPRYPWADPAYEVVHASILDCNRNLLRALQTGSLPETHAADHLKTVELVFAAYQAASEAKVLPLHSD